jgi:hypothetical protein
MTEGEKAIIPFCAIALGWVIGSVAFWIREWFSKRKARQ